VFQEKTLFFTSITAFSCPFLSKPKHRLFIYLRDKETDSGFYVSESKN